MSRVTMFVFNDCRTDARVLREAETLAGAGHEVTIVARPTNLATAELERERRGAIEIVRVPVPRGWRLAWGWLQRPWRIRAWAGVRAKAALSRGVAGIPTLGAIGLAILASLPLSIVRLPFVFLRSRRTGGSSALEWYAHWRFGIRGWARAAAAIAPPADVLHAHDLTGLPAAIESHRRRPSARLVYDSHEIFLEAGATAVRPRWLRWLLARTERAWAAKADALVTVNDALAEELDRRFGHRRTVVVHNCPPRWSPPQERPDLLRAAAGIPEGAPVALYHGGFSLHRGIEQLAAAILEPGLERTHAVCLGYGGQRENLRTMAAESRFGGRLHVLDAVPPEELPPWVASADVGVMAIQRSTLNHWLSTPNKLFECLAAGIPAVVSDFPEMRRIVLEDPDGPLGAVCEPADVADVARAIRSILDLPADEREALRARSLRAAHERWNWETESAKLLALYAEISPAG